MTRYARTLLAKLSAIERSGDGATIHRSRTLRQALFGALDLIERGKITHNDPIFRQAIRTAEAWLSRRVAS
jgi:hypothetical protein